MNAEPPANPLLAVSHPDPYPYYLQLLSRPAPWFEAEIGMWIVARAKHIEMLLHSEAARVRPDGELIPKALAGSDAGELFGRFARMNDGPRHHELRAAAERQVSALETAVASGKNSNDVFTGDDLNDFIERFTVNRLASALKFSPGDIPAIVRSVRAFSRGIAPNASEEDRNAATSAATHLLAAFTKQYPNEDTDGIANRIGLLFQSFDATRGLMGNALVGLARGSRNAIESLLLETLQHDPPVHNTRRYLSEDVMIDDIRMRAGESVLLLLAAANRDEARRTWTFGGGKHACPGQRLSLSMAAAGVTAIAASGIDVPLRCRPIGYVASPNIRIPLFA